MKSGMIDAHRKEGLSIAFVQAIAAVAGVNLSTRALDYGVDGTFRPIVVYQHRRVEAGFPLDYQLKASQNWSISDNEVTYDLEAKTYNDLVIRNSLASVPMVLILLCLPTNTSDWLRLTSEQLILRNCSYWSVIRGEATTNKQTVRIHIPCSNQLTPDALITLMDAVRSGEIYATC